MVASEECEERCRIFFFQAEDGIRDLIVTGVQTCALPIFRAVGAHRAMTAADQSAPGEWPYTRGIYPTMYRQVVDDAPVRRLRHCRGNQRPLSRSEERRVGKEGRSRWSPYH